MTKSNSNNKSAAKANVDDQQLTIKRNSVELLHSNGSITDTSKVDKGSSSRLALLVVHEGAFLEGSNSGSEDELEDSSRPKRDRLKYRAREEGGSEGEQELIGRRVCL